MWRGIVNFKVKITQNRYNDMGVIKVTWTAFSVNTFVKSVKEYLIINNNSYYNEMNININ